MHHIVGFAYENGIYRWRVDYSDEDILFYGWENMVDIITASLNLCLDVTQNSGSSATDSGDSVDDKAQ
ncbi:hypothetical protein DVH05_005400 [Phytophthora capsici]|nr:hypothetical protein DVH05_005400 [Phytophthora capsici]